MWLPLQLVLEFVGRWAAWLGVVAALGAAAALLVALAARRPPASFWPKLAAGGVLGALLGASLAHRFSLPEALTFDIWRRPLPLAWTAGGSLAGGTLAALVRRRTAGIADSPTLPGN